MKRILTAIALSLGLLLGGAVASAPAQAEVQPMVSGSSTYFNAIDPSIPLTIDLKNTSTTGYKYLQSWNTTRNNVARTCPKNSDYRLSWSKPGGVNHLLAAGQCFWPSQPDLYWIGIERA